MGARAGGWVHTAMAASRWRSEDNRQQSLHRRSQGSSQIIRFGDKRLYLLSHPSSTISLSPTFTALPSSNSKLSLYIPSELWSILTDLSSFSSQYRRVPLGIFFPGASCCIPKPYCLLWTWHFLYNF